MEAAGAVWTGGGAQGGGAQGGGRRGGSLGRQRPLLGILRRFGAGGRGVSAFMSVKRKRKKENIPRPVPLNGFWSRGALKMLMKAVISLLHGRPRFGPASRALAGFLTPGPGGPPLGPVPLLRGRVCSEETPEAAPGGRSQSAPALPWHDAAICDLRLRLLQPESPCCKMDTDIPCTRWPCL